MPTLSGMKRATSSGSEAVRNVDMKEVQMAMQEENALAMERKKKALVAPSARVREETKETGTAHHEDKSVDSRWVSRISALPLCLRVFLSFLSLNLLKLCYL